MEERKTIAVLFGGCSPEHSVSLESAAAVLRHMDPDRYIPLMVGITREGVWYRFSGGVEEIAQGRWQESSQLVPAVLSPLRGDHALLLLGEDKLDRVPLDGVFPVLHGRNGEDGSIQGLCELAGIPLVGCGTLASALCMDKDRAHKLAGLAGVRVPHSFTLTAADETRTALTQAADLGYPLFVKPVKAGSSYGVAKVSQEDDLPTAIAQALRYDDKVLVEEAIDGFEVGCAVMGDRELYTGELDEIELASGFFDFTEKYNLITSRIHVPARITPAQAAAVKECAKVIYRALGCSGFARVDMFLTETGEIVFNEVNTIPGFTAHSRFPSMMAAAGLDLTQVVTRAIEQAVGA